MQDDKLLYSYLESMSDKEHPILKEIDRYGHLHTVSARMNSGHLQGLFLKMMVTVFAPKYIVEVGTFLGYSTIAMGLGMPSGAKLISIDNNPETNEVAQSFVNKARLQNRITLLTGDARELITQLDGGIDFAFVDADKPSYSIYYDALIDKLSPRGIMLVDNVLWSGKVLHEQKDKKTKVIHEFNEKVSQDDRVEKVILPIRDGITLIRKV